MITDITVHEAGEKRQGVFAWRDIQRGEEITIDYRLNAFGEDPWECRCGSASCSGYVVGSFFCLDDERQRLYLPYAPAFIRQEYLRRSRKLAGYTTKRVYEQRSWSPLTQHGDEVNHGTDPLGLSRRAEPFR